VRGDLALLEEGDILDEEHQHPLAFPLGGVRVPPDRGEVDGEGEDALPLPPPLARTPTGPCSLPCPLPEVMPYQ
jgi:hypothetical protein